MANEVKEYVDREGLSRLTENINNELKKYAKKEDLEKLDIDVDLTGYAKTENPEFTGTLSVDGVEILYDENSGSFLICVPAGENEWHIPYMPTTVDLSNGEMRINNGTVFHTGNLKNLAWPGQQLDDMTEKAIFMENTGLNKIIGDIETALDSIIAMQNALIGGEAQ